MGTLELIKNFRWIDFYKDDIIVNLRGVDLNWIPKKFSTN